jgi:hypothetical protein
VAHQGAPVHHAQGHDRGASQVSSTYRSLAHPSTQGHGCYKKNCTWSTGTVLLIHNRTLHNGTA